MAGSSHHRRKSNKAGLPLRIEPSSAELFEALSELRELFAQAGWLQFCVALKGYHPQIVNAFVLSFDGFEATVAELKVRVSEDILSQVFDLPLNGERWFKNHKVDEDSLLQFLKPEAPKPDWSVGIPIKHLDQKWGAAVIAIRQYITCEGRYKHLYRFHLRFLLHLTGQRLMNLPFFLIKDLTKISVKIQKNPLTMESSLAHHSLITMIVFNQVIKAGLPIRNFLNNAGFLQKEKLQEKVKSKAKKAAFIWLPIPDDTQETNTPVQTDKKEDETKGRTGPSYVKMTTRSQTKQQQASIEYETVPVISKEQIAEEEAIEKQSIDSQAPRRRSTRAANKYRLNAKALLNPSLKGKEPIIIDNDMPEIKRTKSKKGKTRATRDQAECNLQVPASNLLLQFAEVAEFLTTRSAGEMMEEAHNMFEDHSEIKSPEPVPERKVRKSQRKAAIKK